MNSKQRYKLIFILGFFLILILPSMIEIYARESKILDNRELSNWPYFSEFKYTEKVERYYEDRYGLRNEMIAFSAWYKFHFFKSSPKPKSVILGLDNWLFYNDIEDQIYHSYSNRNLLSNIELQKYYDQYHQNIEISQKHGVSYYCKIVWPNKHTVYDQYWPVKMKIQRSNKLSKRIQIREFFRPRSPNKFFDITDAILDQKESYQLYRKFDTHWNQLGAFLAYQKVMDTIGWEKPYSLNDFKIDFKKESKGDLIKLMGLESIKEKEEVPYLNFSKEELDTTINQYQWEGLSVDDFINSKIEKGKTLLIFGDSFIHKIQWLFLLHYQRVIYLKSSFIEKAVQHFKPDHVFEARVERYL